MTDDGSRCESGRVAGLRLELEMRDALLQRLDRLRLSFGRARR